MVNFLLNHKLLLIILALAVALMVWFGLSSSGGAPSDSLLATESATDSGPEQELVSTLLALRAVKLDGAIFTDPAFMSLKDFSTQIVPEPVGRPNPFAPLIQTAQTAQSAASASAGQAAPNFAPTTGNK